MKTHQEIYNQVRDHLLKQGKRASVQFKYNDQACLYRAADGSKCAAGCLIDDEHYKPSLENKAVSHSIDVQNALHASGVPYDPAEGT